MPFPYPAGEFLGFSAHNSGAFCALNLHQFAHEKSVVALPRESLIAGLWRAERSHRWKPMAAGAELTLTTRRAPYHRTAIHAELISSGFRRA